MENVIQVAKIPTKAPGQNELLVLLATLCYFYPQYTFRQARQLPYKHVVLLLKVAQKQEAIKYLNYVQIASAPHSDKGKAVKKIGKQYEKIANG